MSFLPEEVTQFNNWINDRFTDTGLPAIGRSVGEGSGSVIDSVLGTNIEPVLGDVGEGTPRSVVEALLTAPAGGAGAAPRAAMILRRLGQAAGFGSAAARGWTETGSPLGGLISAGSMGLGNVAIPAVSKGASDVTRAGLRHLLAPASVTTLEGVAPVTMPTLGRVAPAIAGAGAGIVGGTALNEATRQAMMSVGDNALPLDAPERNPFTAENIAANVGGLVPWLYPTAKGVVKSYQAEPLTNPVAVGRLQDWLRMQGGHAPVAESAGKSELAPLAQFPSDGAPDKAKQQWRTHLWLDEQYKLLDYYTKTGEVEKLQLGVQNVQRLLRQLHDTGANTPVGAQSLNDVSVHASAMNDIAIVSPPSNPEELMRFVGDVNALIKEANQLTQRDDETIPRLQKKGLLPEITEDWLKKEFNFSFDRALGDYVFAWKAVVQKASNHLTEGVNTALRNEARVTEESPRVRQYNERTAKAIRSLATLQAFSQGVKIPDTGYIEPTLPVSTRQDPLLPGLTEAVTPPRTRPLINALNERTAEIMANQGFQKPGLSAPLRQERSWFDVLNQAAETYNPETGTFEYVEPARRGGSPRILTMKLHDIIAKDADGKYTWQPRALPATREEGLASTKEMVGLPKTEGESKLESPDEELMYSELTQAPAFGINLDDTGANVPVEDSTTAPASQFTTQLSDAATNTINALAKLSPTDVWSATRRLFTFIDKRGMERIPAKSHGLMSFRQDNMKLAIEATVESLRADQGQPLGPKATEFMENMRKRGGYGYKDKSPRKELMVALDNFFGDPSSEIAEKLPKGTSKLNQRLYEVLTRVADPQIYEPLLNIRRIRGEVNSDSAVPARLAGTSDQAIIGPFSDNLTTDVVSTARYYFKHFLGTKYGYSGELLDLYSEVMASLASRFENAALFSILETNDKAAGKAHMSGVVGVKMAPRNQTPEAYVNHVIETFAHELTHIDGFIAQGYIKAPDAYSEQRTKAYQGLIAVGKTLTPEERHSILVGLDEAMNPRIATGLGRNPADPTLVYGSQSPEEFVSVANQFLLKSLLYGKSDRAKHAAEVLRFLPNEIQRWRDVQYRTISDLIDGLAETLESPEARRLFYRNGEVAQVATSKAIANALRVTANIAQSQITDSQVAATIAASRDFVGNLSPHAAAINKMRWVNVPPLISDQTPVGPVAESISNTANQAIGLAHESIFGDPTERGTRPGIFRRFFTPFQQLMQSMDRAGVPLARDVMNLTLNISPHIKHVWTDVMSPFLKRDSLGRVVFNDDHPLLNKIAKESNGKWRQQLNAVRNWQNRNEAAMFEQQRNGVWVVSQRAQAVWKSISQGLSAEDQQIVINGSLALDTAHQRAASWLIKASTQSVQDRVARALSVMMPSLSYTDAEAQAATVINAYQQNNLAALVGILDTKQMVFFERLLQSKKNRIANLFMQMGVADPADAEVKARQYLTLRDQNIAAANKLIGVGFQDAEKILQGTEGLIGTLTGVEQHLTSRPWFSTESLPGDWIIRYKTPTGEIKYLSGDNQTHAERIARRLVQEGNTLAGQVKNRKELTSYTDVDHPDEILNKFIAVEEQQWKRFVDEIAQGYGQDMAAQLESGYAPGVATMHELETKGLKKFFAKRETKIDTSRYDYLDGFLAYVPKLAASIVYKSSRSQLDMILNDPRSRPFTAFQKVSRDIFEHITTPTGLQELRSLVSSYYLAGNLSSSLINMTQNITGVVPWLINLNQSGGAPKAFGQLWTAIKDATRFTRKATVSELNKTAFRVKGTDPSNWTNEESLAFYLKKASDDGLIEQMVVHDLDHGTSQKALLVAKFGRGDYGDTTTQNLMQNTAYVGSQMLMRTYSWSEIFNNKIALAAGLRQGYEQGLRGTSLYEHAQRFRSLVTFSGGKANQPLYLNEAKTPGTRSAFAMLNTLQQYGLGMISTYLEMGRDALGQSKGLTPLQRRQAQKAFTTAFATQIALGGSLSLPFAGAALAIIEKTTGVPANQLVRQGLAALGGDDEELGNAIADLGLNGAGNHFFGIDLSSRVGVSNLFGISAYRGFNAADMFGPTGSLIANGFQAANLFANNEPLRAARALVPQAFKNTIEMGRQYHDWGDTAFRDPGGNLLYKPSYGESVGYMLGFRPAELSKRRQLAQQIIQSDQNFSASRGRQFDDAAMQLAAGDPTKAHRLVQDLTHREPSVDPKQYYRQIMERVIDATVQKDPLASGPVGNSAIRRQIAGTFGSQSVPRQSEVRLTQLRAQMAQALGVPELLPDKEQLNTALMVDSVTSQGLGRSEAIKFVNLLK